MNAIVQGFREQGFRLIEQRESYPYLERTDERGQFLFGKLDAGGDPAGIPEQGEQGVINVWFPPNRAEQGGYQDVAITGTAENLLEFVSFFCPRV